MYCSKGKSHKSEASQHDSHMEREEFDASKVMRRRDFIKSTSVGLLGTMLALDSPFARVVQARGTSSAGALFHEK